MDPRNDLIGGLPSNLSEQFIIAAILGVIVAIIIIKVVHWWEARHEHV